MTAGVDDIAMLLLKCWLYCVNTCDRLSCICTVVALHMMDNCTFKACALFKMLQWHSQQECAKLPSCLYIAGQHVILCIIHMVCMVCMCLRT